MNNKKKNFYNHFFLYILVLLILVLVSASYYRFILKKDYMVGYEGVCDQNLHKCFVGCEDDMCSKEYYYTKMEKYAPDLISQCGNDISNCEVANECLITDKKCTLVYCDPLLNSDICSKNTEILEETLLNNLNNN